MLKRYTVRRDPDTPTYWVVWDRRLGQMREVVPTRDEGRRRARTYSALDNVLINTQEESREDVSS